MSVSGTSFWNLLFSQRALEDHNIPFEFDSIPGSSAESFDIIQSPIPDLRIVMADTMFDMEVCAWIVNSSI